MTDNQNTGTMGSGGTAQSLPLERIAEALESIAAFLKWYRENRC